VSNCVINGRSINVGYGYFTNLTAWANLENIDVIYPEFATLWLGDPTWHGAVFDAKLDAVNSDITVENQRYNNIVIYGDVDQLFEFTIEDTSWGAPGPAQGNMRNIHFRNIEVLGTQKFKSVIRGKDSNNQFYDITFTNLKIDGTYVDSDNYQDYFDIGPYAYNISFDAPCSSLVADLNDDCIVDVEDFMIMAEHWMEDSRL
jgi:hypothetical protein